MIEGTPRILIIRFSAIGDVVRVLPALHILREAYPDACIEWAVEPKSAGVIEGHPALDRVLVFHRSEGMWESTRAFLRFCGRIRNSRYDIVIDFHGILKSGLATAASGARLRYGFARPRSQEGSYLATNRKTKLRSQRLNRVEENLALCEQIVPGHFWPSVMVFVPEETQQAVDGFFHETFDGGKRVVAMHAPMPRREKRWPAEHFATLIDLLLADGRFEVLVTWGPGQFASAEEIVRLAKRRPVIAPETDDLKHYAWLIHRSDLYFGGDTGPMHLAWAMGTPVVAVFGGTDPTKHAPYRHPHIVLFDEPGSGAGKADAPNAAHERLRRITPDMAYEACVQLTLRNGANERGSRA